MIRGVRRVLPLLLAAVALDAQPRFDESTITASRSAIHPLETIDYTITLRNSGNTEPVYMRVANALPTSAMFVSASPDWRFIEAERELSWLGTLEPGSTKILRLSIITRPESAGLMLANRVAIHYDGAYHALDHHLEIQSPPHARGVTHAGMIVLAYFAIAGLVFFVFRRPSMPLRNVGLTLVLISSGFLLFFVDLARRDSRMQNDFVETRCTILDSMTRYVESRSASTTSASRRSGNGSWTPLFALRYLTHAGETISIGYASPSRVQFGSRKPAEAALAALPRGGTAPCWYDPKQPKDVVLVRSLGGAYGFALIPLLTLLIGALLLRRAWH